MTGLLVLALILQSTLQGPRNLEVPDKVNPPLVVPAGTTIPVSLITRLSTKNAGEGDGVYARTVFPVTVEDEIVIPVGSYIRGKVVEVDRPGRVKGKPELTISFQTIVLPNGQNLDIFGTLASVGGDARKTGETSVEGDSSTGEDLKRIGTLAADGALIGVIGSRSGKGAAIGAGVGAAAGAAVALLTRGKDLVLEPGTTLEIKLDRPLEP